MWEWEMELQCCVKNNLLRKYEKNGHYYVIIIQNIKMVTHYKSIVSIICSSLASEYVLLGGFFLHLLNIS